MTVVLALPYVFGRVVERFELDAIEADQRFGWREPARQLTSQKRITWTPGDANGALGDITAAQRPGGNPRPLATLAELCTVEIQASDPTQPMNELLQYSATRLLYDDWYRAIYLTCRGQFEIVTSSWMRPATEVAHGRCLRVVIAVNAMIPDLVRTAAPVDVSASIDVTLLDVTENLTVTKDGPA